MKFAWLKIVWLKLVEVGGEEGKLKIESASRVL